MQSPMRGPSVVVQETEAVEPRQVKGGAISNWLKSSLSREIEGFLLQIVYMQAEDDTSVNRYVVFSPMGLPHRC